LNKRIWSSLLIGVFMLLGAISFAWSAPGEPTPPGWSGLSPKEKSAMRSIREKYQDQRDEINLSMEEKKLELVKLLKQDPPNKPLIKQKINELIILEKARQDLMVDEFFEVRSHLSPTQATRFTRKLILLILNGVERKGGEF